MTLEQLCPVWIRGVLLCTLITSYVTTAQSFAATNTVVRDSITKSADDTTNGPHVFALPFLTYAPETHFRLGLAGIASFDLDSKEVKQRRASTLSTTVSLTQLHQYSLTARLDLYFNNLISRFSSRVAYERMPNRFYGFGAYTKQSDEVWYHPDYLRTEFMYLHRIVHTVDGQGIAVGGRLEYSTTSMYGDIPTPPGSTPEPVGWRGGVSTGLGIVATLDTRDNPYYPTAHEYIEVRTMMYLPGLGSSFDYNRTYVDLRKYISAHIGAYTPVLCAQVLWDNTSGNAPFYDMPTYGGSDKVRGILAGRYVDKSSLSAQLELRSQLFWVVGAAAFIAAGDVAPSLREHSIRHSTIAGGFGMRAYLNPEAGLIGRIDIGFSKWGTGLYISFAEAW